MAKRRFASKFYNCSYDSLVPVRKAPADRLIPCTVYGEITKETVAALKDRFAFQMFSESAKDKNGDFPGIRFSVKGTMPNGNLKSAKEFLKEKEMRLRHDKSVYMHFEIPGGYLYSGWKSGRKTKIKPEDLPKSYVRISNYKKNGYMETAGVVDMIYEPGPFHNHTFKDDFLYIAYKERLPEAKQGCWSELLEACDEYVFGNDIINVLKGIETNNPDNQELLDKVQTIKSQMVVQYNAYVDQMRQDFGREEKYIKDFSELEW
ncbi:hypothetical protein G7B22_22030 [Blautia sp. MSK.20.9]|uniref:hypothetical protein n=1 Tax=Blautia sp. MSK20_18 TaxID=2883186 RepID=UPI00156E00A5|nr:hypothetical protein [Blautia sp. MSK20_18]MCB7507885.1 hypothetical protein [Blautia sp. MSK20_18]NSK11107.1 hypothetical protein [Blautia sp. MSK.20.9]